MAFRLTLPKAGRPGTLPSIPALFGSKDLPQTTLDLPTPEEISQSIFDLAKSPAMNVKPIAPGATGLPQQTLPHGSSEDTLTSVTPAKPAPAPVRQPSYKPLEPAFEMDLLQTVDNDLGEYLRDKGFDTSNPMASGQVDALITDLSRHAKGVVARQEGATSDFISVDEKSLRDYSPLGKALDVPAQAILGGGNMAFFGVPGWLYQKFMGEPFPQPKSEAGMVGKGTGELLGMIGPSGIYKAGAWAASKLGIKLANETLAAGKMYNVLNKTAPFAVGGKIARKIIPPISARSGPVAKFIHTVANGAASLGIAEAAVTWEGNDFKEIMKNKGVAAMSGAITGAIFPTVALYDLETTGLFKLIPWAVRTYGNTVIQDEMNKLIIGEEAAFDEKTLVEKSYSIALNAFFSRHGMSWAKYKEAQVEANRFDREGRAAGSNISLTRVLEGTYKRLRSGQVPQLPEFGGVITPPPTENAPSFTGPIPKEVGARDINRIGPDLVDSIRYYSMAIGRIPTAEEVSQALHIRPEIAQAAMANRNLNLGGQAEILPQPYLEDKDKIAALKAEFRQNRGQDRGQEPPPPTQPPISTPAVPPEIMEEKKSGQEMVLNFLEEEAERLEKTPMSGALKDRAAKTISDLRDTATYIKNSGGKKKQEPPPSSPAPAQVAVPDMGQTIRVKVGGVPIEIQVPKAEAEPAGKSAEQGAPSREIEIEAERLQKLAARIRRTIPDSLNDTIRNGRTERANEADELSKQKFEEADRLFSEEIERGKKKAPLAQTYKDEEGRTRISEIKEPDPLVSQKTHEEIAGLKDAPSPGDMVTMKDGKSGEVVAVLDNVSGKKDERRWGESVDEITGETERFPYAPKKRGTASINVRFEDDKGVVTTVNYPLDQIKGVKPGRVISRPAPEAPPGEEIIVGGAMPATRRPTKRSVGVELGGERFEGAPGAPVIRVYDPASKKTYGVNVQDKNLAVKFGKLSDSTEIHIPAQMTATGKYTVLEKMGDTWAHKASGKAFTSSFIANYIATESLKVKSAPEQEQKPQTYEPGYLIVTPWEGAEPEVVDPTSGFLGKRLSKVPRGATISVPSELSMTGKPVELIKKKGSGAWTVVGQPETRAIRSYELGKIINQKAKEAGVKRLERPPRDIKRSPGVSREEEIGEVPEGSESIEDSFVPPQELVKQDEIDEVRKASEPKTIVPDRVVTPETFADYDKKLKGQSPLPPTRPGTASPPKGAGTGPSITIGSNTFSPTDERLEFQLRRVPAGTKVVVPAELTIGKKLEAAFEKGEDGAYRTLPSKQFKFTTEELAAKIKSMAEKIPPPPPGPSKDLAIVKKKEVTRSQGAIERSKKRSEVKSLVKEIKEEEKIQEEVLEAGEEEVEGLPDKLIPESQRLSTEEFWEELLRVDSELPRQFPYLNDTERTHRDQRTGQETLAKIIDDIRDKGPEYFTSEGMDHYARKNARILRSPRAIDAQRRNQMVPMNPAVRGTSVDPMNKKVEGAFAGQEAVMTKTPEELFIEKEGLDEMAEYKNKVLVPAYDAAMEALNRAIPDKADRGFFYYAQENGVRGAGAAFNKSKSEADRHFKRLLNKVRSEEPDYVEWEEMGSVKPDMDDPNSEGPTMGAYFTPIDFGRLADQLRPYFSKIKKFGMRWFNETKGMPEEAYGLFRMMDNYFRGAVNLASSQTQIMHDYIGKSPLLRENIDMILRGEVPETNMGLPPEVLHAVREFKLARRKFSEMIGDMNDLAPEVRELLEQTADSYLTRSYKMFEYRKRGGFLNEIRGKNVFEPGTDTRKKMTDFLLKSFPGEFPQYTPQEIEDFLDSWLRGNPLKFKSDNRKKSMGDLFRRRALFGGQDVIDKFMPAEGDTADILTAKKDIRNMAKRAIFGEIDAKNVPFEKIADLTEAKINMYREKLDFASSFRDIFEEFAGLIGADNIEHLMISTTIKQAKMAFHGRFFKEIHDNFEGVLWSKEPTPGWRETTLKSKGEGDRTWGVFGKYDTVYVSPEFNTFLKYDFTPRVAETSKILEKLLVNPWKRVNVIYSWPALMRNFIGGTLFSTLTRTSFFNPINLPEYFDSAKLLLARMKEDGYEHWAKLLGVGLQDVSYWGEEIPKMKQSFMKLDQNQLFEKLMWLPRKADSILGGIMSGSDQFFRISAFYNLTEKLGYSPHEAVKFLDRCTPNYRNLPAAVEILRRVPVFGPFVSFPANVMKIVMLQAYDGASKVQRGMGYGKEKSFPGTFRGEEVGSGGSTTTYTGPEEDLRQVITRKKNPVLAAQGASQLARLGVFMGLLGVLRSVSAKIFGIDEEEMEAMEQMGPTWSRDTKPIYYRAHGKIHGIDTSYIDPAGDIKTIYRAAMKGNWQGVKDRLSLLKSPVVDVWNALSGRDPKTGDKMGLGDAAALVLRDTRIPASLPFFSSDSILNFLKTGKFEPRSGALTTTQMKGLIDAYWDEAKSGQTFGDAMFSFGTGIKILQFDPEKVYRNSQAMLRYQSQQLSANYSQYKREHPNAPEFEAKKELDRFKKERDIINKKIQENKIAWDKIQK